MWVICGDIRIVSELRGDRGRLERHGDIWRVLLRCVKHTGIRSITQVLLKIVKKLGDIQGF